jgi:hypothetical protein
VAATLQQLLTGELLLLCTNWVAAAILQQPGPKQHRRGLWLAGRQAEQQELWWLQ